MTRTRKPRRVKCYALMPLLTKTQQDAVRPFMRATWSETWAAMGGLLGGAAPDVSFDGRMAVRDAAWGRAWIREPIAAACNADESRELERVLYARAASLGHTPIMAPGRSK